MAEALSHKDPEADFFENIRHIQLHRRTKALRKLAAVVSSSSSLSLSSAPEGTPLSNGSIMSFLLPLASQVVFTPSGNVEQNLKAEAVSVIGAVASRLGWNAYSSLLRHYLRQLPKRSDIQKTIIRW